MLIEDGPTVEITSDRIVVAASDGQRSSFSRTPLPYEFLSWQSDARLQLFSVLKRSGARAAMTNSVHLPVLATCSDHSFPINLACRGMGILPKQDDLERITRQFELAREESSDQDWSASLKYRVSVAAEFYASPERFDPYMLGGLEIFEGQTLKNLLRNPLASLLYVGEAPHFPSLQINGVVTFEQAPEPYYHFLLAARELFAGDSFHIKQIRYPLGLLFHVVECRKKTPHSRFYPPQPER